MSMFGKILNKLGLKKEAAAAPEKPVAKPQGKNFYTETSEPAAQKPAAKPAARMMDREAMARRQNALQGKLGADNKPQPMAMVDVMSKLEAMAAGTGLNWRQSIVDLLKVLDIDSSYQARKALAEELGCPPEFMSDSAKMNTWLHKTVLKKIAENGGNIPQDLLD